MAVITPATERVTTVTAAQLASRIEIPTQLPPHYNDGQPMHHLSQSSIGLFYRCPEAFRRRYICGEKGPASGEMFLGSVVDKTLGHYHQTRLDTNELLPLDELQEFYRRTWQEQREREEADRGIDWSELHSQAAHEIGLEGIGVALKELVPQLGRPVAVQRKLEFALTPKCQWVVQGYIDLETEVEQLGQEHPTNLVVDYKVKGDPLQQNKADQDLQASLYLTGRWIEGNRAEAFWWPQLLRPGKNRSKIGSKITRTQRTVGQMRAVRMRIAQAANSIVASYERYGPERPWPFADPGSWSCSRKYCFAYDRCPGGAGL